MPTLFANSQMSIRFHPEKKTAGPIQSLITLPQNVKMKSRNTSRKLADKQMHDRSTAY